MPSSLASIPLAQSLDKLKERLVRAAARARRNPEEVEILAVTKNVPAERVAEAWRLGLRQFGESRVQEAEKKRSAFKALLPGETDERWHMIGHLQSNKARRAVELFDCLQSVDSLKLAEFLDKEGGRRAQPVSCLVEIKVSEETAKQGLAPDDLGPFLEHASRLSFLRVEGLMGLAPYHEDAEKARPYFASLRKIFERQKRSFLVPRPLLSMGMSQDFEAAIMEGSNMIRIGSALFGPRTV